MEFRPTCAVPGCGGLGIYRCGACRRVFCGQHAEVLSETAAQGVDGIEGSWRVRCHACQSRLSGAPYPWDATATGGSEQTYETTLEQGQESGRHPQ